MPAPLSKLQKYVLRQGLESAGYKVSKKKLINFYNQQKAKPKKEDQINIITKSVDRLINRGLVKGYGLKTVKKWFVWQVILTKNGLRKARELAGQQQKLPLKVRKLKVYKVYKVKE